MKNIAVFCGSSMGNHPEFREQAMALGRYLAFQGIGLVYGGARVGLMGAVADAVLAHGGKATGVIPRFLAGKELEHTGLTRLIWVDSMHERKQLIHEMCDGVIALPGGFGTLDELFEALTWGQLGLHTKPTGILDTGGFYGHLLALADHMVQSGLLKQSNRDMILVDQDPEALLGKMRTYQPPAGGKWIR